MGFKTRVFNLVDIQYGYISYGTGYGSTMLDNFNFSGINDGLDCPWYDAYTIAII